LLANNQHLRTVLCLQRGETPLGLAVGKLPNRLDNFMALLAHPGIDVNAVDTSYAYQVKALLDTSYAAYQVKVLLDTSYAAFQVNVLLDTS
jgi:hypothetical protein